jgi:hypothetical protein
MGLARVLFVVAAALLALPPIAGAQGLGDASKKEKARREQSKAPKTKTYTQDDTLGLPPVANETPDTSSASAPPPAGGSGDLIFPSARESSAGGSSENARRGEEAQWRARVARAQARVEESRKRYEDLAAKNLVPGYEYQDSRGRTTIHSIEELQAMTARAKADLEAAEKALADLLEEARRASVPPGWLR